MHKGIPLLVVAASLLAACNPNSKNTMPKPPAAKEIPHQMQIHGHQRTDNYYWLRDDKREAPDVIAHLNAENAYTRAVMAHTEALQKSLFEEITARLKKDDNSVPYKKGNYWYYNRFEKGSEYRIHARRMGSLESDESILLDEGANAKAHDYYNLGDLQVSPNEKLLGYSEDTLSRRIYTIRIKDLETGELLPDSIEQTSGQVIWANDNTTIFYVKKDPVTLLEYQVYRHRIGTPQSEDTLVYEESDKSFYTELFKTRDDSTIGIRHNSTTTQAASIINANRPEDPFTPFLTRERDHEYRIFRTGDWFYILTNWQAKNFRVMRVHRDKTTEKAAWQDVIPHRPNTLMRDVLTFDRHLISLERDNGQNYVRVYDLEGNHLRDLSFKESAFWVGFEQNPQLATAKIRLNYSSLTTPFSVLEYDLNTGAAQVLKEEEVGGFNANDYKSERLFVTARDGTQVPVSLVYREDRFKGDGTNPMLQYGYGSYGATVDPYLSKPVISLLDRGFVYAIAHIRGGQMLGRQWYEDGRLLSKNNTFTDFIDVTKALVARNYAAADKVIARGRSAGGLLVGAVINQAPELYLAASASVPFVDVVTTMLDASIPLTTNEYDEWGNPNEKQFYDYMLSYSPYDQIEAKAYPHLYVSAGLHDSQVQYFEPAKWVAKLRAMKTGDARLIFSIDMETGHGGASGRYRRYEETALEFAFFLDLLNIRQ